MEMMVGFLKARFEDELLTEKSKILNVGFLDRKIKELGAEPNGCKEEKGEQLWDLVMGVDHENLLSSDDDDDDTDVGCCLIDETEDENRDNPLLAELMRTSTAWENEEAAGQNDTDAEEESRQNANGDPGPSNDAPPDDSFLSTPSNDTLPDDSLLSTQKLKTCTIPKLKGMLRERKLAVSGNKPALIERLINHASD
jgi:hypothetical protein